jgi:hypothetical protein
MQLRHVTQIAVALLLALMAICAIAYDQGQTKAMDAQLAKHHTNF